MSRDDESKSPPWFTGSGDDGSTGLLGSGRVRKHHAQPEAFGAVDELSAVLGLARSLSHDDEVRACLLRIQRELYEMMAELAATPEVQARFRVIGAKHVEALADDVKRFGASVQIPREFVVAGDTTAGAALDMARTVARRAEREITRILDDGLLANSHILAYINRLSSLLFVLARAADASAGGPSTPARDDSA